MYESYDDENVTRELRKKNNPRNPYRIQTFDLIPLILSGEKLSRERDRWVSFSELLYEKKVDPFDWAKKWALPSVSPYSCLVTMFWCMLVNFATVIYHF